MTSDELQQHYSSEAFLANSIGLSVPVSLQLQQLVELRKISALLEKLIELSARPPVIVEPAKVSLSASSKKDSRT